MALNPDDVLLSEGQLRVRGKGNKLRLLPLAPETTQLLDHYLQVERPDPCSPALFVVLKGPARGARMTPAGLRSLFRHHRNTSGVELANPHRFRHYVPFRTMSCNCSIALYFRPILNARADIVLTPLPGHGEEGVYREVHHRWSNDPVADARRASRRIY